jgi:tetratricopeptide (TPR) repeat protein
MSSEDENMSENELWARVSSKEVEVKIDAYRRLASKAYFEERYSECLEMNSISKELLIESGRETNHVEIGLILASMTEALERLERVEEAINTIEEAIGLCKEFDDPRLGDYLRYKGRLLFQIGDSEKSIACHRESLALPDIGPWEHSKGVDYLNIGMSLNRLERFSEAVIALKESMSAFIESEDENEGPKWIAHVYGEITESYVGLEMPDEIEYYGQRALDWWETAVDRHRIWNLRLYLSMAKRMRGDLEIAKDMNTVTRNMVIVDGFQSQNAFMVRIDREDAKILALQGKEKESAELARRASSVEETLNIFKNKSKKEEAKI